MGRLGGYAALLIGLLVIGLLAFSAAAKPGKDLKKARRLVESQNAVDRLVGVRILRSIDSRDALRLMSSVVGHTLEDIERLGTRLDRLDDTYKKLTDRLWQFKSSGNTGAYMRLRSRRDEIIRQYNVLAPRIETLFRVIPPALGAIREYREPGTRAAIEKGSKGEFRPVLRMAFIDALGRRNDEAVVPLLLDLLGARDARARAAVLRALVAHVDAPGVVDAARALEEDKSWAVRLASYELVARAPLAVAVPWLVRAARQEDGEIAVAVDDFLFQLTGQTFREEPQSWGGWLKVHRDAIEKGTFRRVAPKAREGRQTVSSFFSIPIVSKRLVFAIDVSGSMGEDDLRPRDAVTKGIMNKHRLPDNRLGIAKAEVIRAITGLPEDALFNVVVYSDYAKSMSGRLQRATKGSKRGAIAWVKARRMGGLTNIYDALVESFTDPMARSGGASRFARMPDTIIFLTDGQASRGRLAKTNLLVDLVRIWNGPAGVAVHCVGIGKDHDKNLLRTLAGENHGYYVDIHKGKRHPKQRRRTLTGLKIPPVAEARQPEVEQPDAEPDPAADLKSDDYEVRLAAANAIARMGEGGSRYIPALIEAIADSDSDVAEAVHAALVKVGKAALLPVAKLLGTGDADEARSAAKVLGRFGPEARPVMNSLVRTLSLPRGRARLEAIVALGEIANKSDVTVVQILELVGRTPDTRIRDAARESIRRIQAR